MLESIGSFWISFCKFDKIALGSMDIFGDTFCITLLIKTEPSSKVEVTSLKGTPNVFATDEFVVVMSESFSIGVKSDK